MSVEIIDVAAIAPQCWHNGGGQTREVLTWPPGQSWELRVSRADIDFDGPFSKFTGVRRWFTVLQGNGVKLKFSAQERILVPGDEPICFDGGLAPDCHLLRGSTQDLNLMYRNGNAVMRKAINRIQWNELFTVRCLYTAAAGHWQNSQEQLAVPAHSLLWSDNTASDNWRFEALHLTGISSAWWLGYTPDRNP